LVISIHKTSIQQLQQTRQSGHWGENLTQTNNALTKQHAEASASPEGTSPRAAQNQHKDARILQSSIPTNKPTLSPFYS